MHYLGITRQTQSVVAITIPTWYFWEFQFKNIIIGMTLLTCPTTWVSIIFSGTAMATSVTLIPLQSSWLKKFWGSRLILLWVSVWSCQKEVMGQMHNPILWTKRSILACSKAIDSEALASGGLGGGNLPSVGSPSEPSHKNRIEGLCELLTLLIQFQFYQPKRDQVWHHLYTKMN